MQAMHDNRFPEIVRTISIPGCNPLRIRVHGGGRRNTTATLLVLEKNGYNLVTRFSHVLAKTTEESFNETVNVIADQLFHEFFNQLQSTVFSTHERWVGNLKCICLI